MVGENLLGQPIQLPEDPAASALAAGSPVSGDWSEAERETVRAAAAQHPASALAWAMLAEDALAQGRPVESYAFARTGYHRSLDALRRAGWRGTGSVPWSHEPNRGFLRSLAALSRAAGAIGEDDEAQRCADFLRESSREAATELGF